MKFINIGLIALVIPIAIAFEFVRPVLLSLAQSRAGWIDAVSPPVVWATLIAFGLAPFIAGGRDHVRTKLIWVVLALPLSMEMMTLIVQGIATSLHNTYVHMTWHTNYSSPLLWWFAMVAG